MSKPKVLLLLHELSYTGSPKIALEAVEQFRERIDLRIVSIDGGPMEERCRRLAPLELLRHPTQRKLTPHFGKGLLRRLIEQSLQRWEPDVIYINSVAAVRANQFISLPPAPKLLHIHELDLSYECLFHEPRYPFPSVDRFIAVSNPVRDLLASRYGIPPAKIRLIPEWISDFDFQRQQEDRHFDVPFVVGGAGRPEWRKGMTLWLQTAVELRRLMPQRPLRFVWVGVRNNEMESIGFREEARRLRMDDLVEFVPVTGEPFRHFSRFDVFAMTSWEDPCPIVVLENMMLRKPVLCFAGGGGAPEEVGETGVVVADFDPAAMAREIASLASDPERRRRLGEAARARVGEHFLASIQAPNIFEEINQLTRRNSVDK